jgi:hypothetical protein
VVTELTCLDAVRDMLAYAQAKGLDVVPYRLTSHPWVGHVRCAWSDPWDGVLLCPPCTESTWAHQYAIAPWIRALTLWWGCSCG